MARRQRSGCGIWMLFWIIIILVLLIIFLQNRKDEQGKKLSSRVNRQVNDQVNKIKNYIFKTPDKIRTFEKNKNITVELYFVRHIEKNDKLALFKVKRTVHPSSTPVIDTINLLLEGPTLMKKKERLYPYSGVILN